MVFLTILFKLLFYYPGRLLLWFQYMFPKKGNYFRSHRQYKHGGAVTAFIASCSIWGIVALLLLMILSDPDSDVSNKPNSNIASLSNKNIALYNEAKEQAPPRVVVVSQEASKIRYSPAPIHNANKAIIVDESIEIERFMTEITPNDTVNSRGKPLSDPVLILMQDRANAHKFGNPDHDDLDSFFSKPAHRANLGKYLKRGSFPLGVQEAVMEGRGILRLRLYKNSMGDTCLDVAMRIRDQVDYDPNFIIRD